jgi:hypothetical protein
MKRSSELFDVGFHGDKYLLNLVGSIISNCEFFIETGCNIGSTLIYVAKEYPQIICYSTEPNAHAFKLAKKNTNNFVNVKLFNENSISFLNLLEEYKDIFSSKVLFWLDAHGYGYDWQLKNEIQFITSRFNHAYILIDDFKVLNSENFNYLKYEDQECSFEYIEDSIAAENFELYYPCYTEKTSSHHPLTGWGLIVIERDKIFSIPEKLKGNIVKEI